MDPENKIYSENYINGKWRKSTGTSYAEIVNPATEKVIGKVVKGTTDDVDKAAAAAKIALPTWAATPREYRIELFQRLINEIERRTDSLGSMITEEMGTVISYAREIHVGKSIISIQPTWRHLKRFVSKNNMLIQEFTDNP